MRKFDVHFSSLLTLHFGRWGCLWQTPDFAATMLNLIRAEFSVTAGWLPSCHVPQWRGIFGLSEMA